jgi:type I restriction enzyme R subunit
VDAATQRLRDEAPDFLPLRDYQLAAIKAVEDGLAAGRRELLLAMATGTGKTRTCIGLTYRLVKAKRFRRILFLAPNAFSGSDA